MNDYDQRTEPAVTFLGEQDGGPERCLKSALHTRFAEIEAIQRAYLVRVQYGSAGPQEIALALVAPTADKDAVVSSVHRQFRSLFNVTQHLDIIFLTPAQEGKVSRVCPPFFLRHAPTT